MSILYWHDIENLQSAQFFHSIDPQVLLSWTTNLLKKQKYFPNSKSVLYI